MKLFSIFLVLLSLLAFTSDIDPPDPVQDTVEVTLDVAYDAVFVPLVHYYAEVPAPLVLPKRVATFEDPYTERNSGKARRTVQQLERPPPVDFYMRC